MLRYFSFSANIFLEIMKIMEWVNLDRFQYLWPPHLPFFSNFLSKLVPIVHPAIPIRTYASHMHSVCDASPSATNQQETTAKDRKNATFFSTKRKKKCFSSFGRVCVHPGLRRTSRRINKNKQNAEAWGTIGLLLPIRAFLMLVVFLFSFRFFFRSFQMFLFFVAFAVQGSCRCRSLGKSF